MPPTIGVVLSGCGVNDGTEIHEAVIAMLALTRAGATVSSLAPNIPQLHTVNHLAGIATGETRRVLVESARIARGAITDLGKVHADDLDGVFFPGGFGAAKNLSTFALEGADCTVQPEVARIIEEVYAQGKPIGAVCIAPAIIAKVLGREGVEVTIGDDPETARSIEAMGARHVPCPVDQCVVDEAHKIVTAAAYMLANDIAEAAAGIEAAVEAFMDLVG